MLSYGIDKVKMFAKIFPESSNVNDSDVCPPSFPSGTNLNLCNILVLLPTWLRRTYLDSFKTCCVF